MKDSKTGRLQKVWLQGNGEPEARQILGALLPYFEKRTATSPTLLGIAYAESGTAQPKVVVQ